jgi:hypothetical protein
MRKIDKDEYVVCVYPESCAGPGWSNQVYWVVVQKQGGGRIRLESLQPDEMTQEMCTVFKALESLHRVARDGAAKVLGEVRG